MQVLSTLRVLRRVALWPTVQAAPPVPFPLPPVPLAAQGSIGPNNPRLVLPSCRAPPFRCHHLAAITYFFAEACGAPLSQSPGRPQAGGPTARPNSVGPPINSQLAVATRRRTRRVDRTCTLSTLQRGRRNGEGVIETWDLDGRYGGG